MKYFKKMIGEKVYLSPMSMEDVEITTKWLNDREMTDFYGVSYFQNTFQSEKEWFESEQKKQTHQYAIVKQSDDKLIGYIGFDDINQIHRTANTTIFIGEKHNMSKGYGTEAMRLLVAYGFDVLNLNNIKLEVYDFNERAIRSYEKVGFKKAGRRREAYYLNNKYYDLIIMDIIRSDYYN